MCILEYVYGLGSSFGVTRPLTAAPAGDYPVEQIQRRGALLGLDEGQTGGARVDGKLVQGIA